MTRLLLQVAGLFASLDFVASMAASGFLKAYLGQWYVLAQPQVFVMSLIIVHIAFEGLRSHRLFLLCCLAFVSVGLFEWIDTRAIGGYADFALLQFLFGFLYPAMLLLFVASFEEDRRLLFWRCFFIGFSLYLCAGFVLLVVDGILFRNILSAGVGAAIISLRYAYANSLFSLVMGNMNKTSNYLLMATLLGPIVLGLRADDPKGNAGDLRLFRIFSGLATVMMILMFSRLVLLLLPLPLYLNRRLLFRHPRRIALGFTGLLIAAYLYWSAQVNVVFRYLVFSEYLGGKSLGFLGTGTSRLETWNTLSVLLKTPSQVLLGIGYGSFGGREGCPECGTHNLFLDHWLGSGPYGVIILTLLISVALFQTVVKRNYYLGVVTAVLILLAMREYSFAYLNVTSMGGIIFVTIFYGLFHVPPEPSTGARFWRNPGRVLH